MKRRAWIGLAAGGALIAGAGIAVGPAAPWLADQLADGQRIGRYGRIKVDGVTGSWIGALRAEQMSIADAEGVWLEAQDITLDWNPARLAFGAVDISNASIANARVLRRPVLSERRPPTDVKLDVHVGAGTIGTVTLDEPVFGAAAQFTTALAIDLRGGSLQMLSADARRLDSDADRLRIFYRPDDGYALSADAYSAPGGVFARALGIGDEGMRAEARGEGTAETGQATYSADVGDAALLQGTATWTPSRWSLTGSAELARLPALASLARRIGASVALEATGARVGAFTARAQTPFLTAELEGELDEERNLVGPARIIASTERASDIARESPFTLGPARLEGELRRARGTTAIQGALAVSRIEALGEAVSLSGPVRLALNDERFTLSAELAAPQGASGLFASARLETAMSYDRGRARYALERATLRGDALAIDAQGWATRGDGEFSGAWRVRRLQALPLELEGEAAGRWRAFAGDDSVWQTSIDGQAARVGGKPALVAQLLGAAPRLDARFAYENGGVTVSYARVDGARVRAGARGRIVRGQADLALEASAQGPLDLGGAQIVGAATATGRLSGPLARPSLNATANLSSFDAGGVIIEQPAVTFTLAPGLNGYAGRADIQGRALGQPATASADVDITAGALALNQLEATLGALRARGDARFTPDGAYADLAIDGALDGLTPDTHGRIAGSLRLEPATVRLDAQFADARFGALRLRAANIRAHGPMSAITAEYDVRGRLGQAPLTFAGTAIVALDDDATTVSADGRGVLAGADVFTRAPIRARLMHGAREASLNVAMGDGVVSATWRERARSIYGEARAEDAPLAPLAAIWNERATGRIDGRVQLANQGSGLAGEAALALQDVRFAGRQRAALGMRIDAELTPSRLTATVDARSADGLMARLEADAPVVTDDDPIRVALAPERRGQATWSVSGPAASLWAAARLRDQALEGQLEGEGTLRFGAGYLAGDGFLEIADGRFEDKLTGVTLVDVDARVALGEQGVTIQTVTAAGANGGRIVATGGSANPREGRITVALENVRIADRPEARARANGELTLAWEGLHSTLSGGIDIIEANLDMAAQAEAGIPTLDVIEINRPDLEDEPLSGEDEAPRSNGSTELNVRISAPGRVYTRGRGVDAEWALDMRLAGTARAPRVFGEARATRGSIALSGQPFEIDTAIIRFNGDPLDAQIDLVAERSTPDLTAYLTLTGTARDPEVSFSSDPGLPEDEILPQILFGRSVEDLSGFEAAQLAASLATLSGRASLDLVGAARAVAGLDRLNVRQDADGGFLVAGGVYLTRDVYLELARGALGEAQTRVEYTLRPRLVLITTFDNGDQRVSLRWRRESD
ncbi:MAG: translocation/assembly module TamB domain-containing protein [Hyphomonadaceae bacterium]|nr:translocation/assembly module TamB domain-containing protein [Hyphomonadaceae bacterium]